MPDAPAAPRDPFLRPRGILVPKHPQFTTGMIRRALREGTYETREAEAVLATARPGDTVLELGGGIGFISALIGARCAPKRIVTYEANPDLVPYIAQVHAANGITCAEVRGALLAPQAGPDRMFHIRGNRLSSSLDGDLAPDTILRSVPVPQHAAGPVLDALRPDLLVCDIEGAEADLLPAVDWTGLRAAVIELHPQWIGAAGVRAVFEAMHRAGLVYFPKASHAKVVTFRRDW